MENPKIDELKLKLVEDLQKLNSSLQEKDINLQDWITIVSSIFEDPQTLEYIERRLNHLALRIPEVSEVGTLFSKFIEDCKKIITEEAK